MITQEIENKGMESITCRNCQQEVRLKKVSGYNPVLTGTTFKNKETKEVFVVCWNCLRALKIKLQSI